MTVINYFNSKFFIDSIMQDSNQRLGFWQFQKIISSIKWFTNTPCTWSYFSVWNWLFYEAHPESKFPDDFPFQVSVISRVNCTCVTDLWRINHMPAGQMPHRAISVVAVVQNGLSYSFSRCLRGSVGNKILECKKHWTNWNLSSALSGLWAEHHE